MSDGDRRAMKTAFGGWCLSPNLPFSTLDPRPHESVKICISLRTASATRLLHYYKLTGRIDDVVVVAVMTRHQQPL